ncbi:MAG: 2OG-Fe(II) oxygenase [Candidatus Sericytochromatia bacterium]|nr:2OG-Fe(II) oxygenase [Candidatus Sericytochromatia bacterium]
MQGFWRFGRFRHYRLQAAPLAPQQVAEIRRAVLNSPLMGASNLNQRFTGTYGFSVAFCRSQLDEVITQFPAFAPFFEAALRPECNAFFLNPLLITNGAGVAPHIDLSLSSHIPGVRTPRSVSVLYLEVPPSLRGGDLKLYEGQRLKATVTPREGALVTFRGELRHEVTPVDAGAPDIYEARLSLVVEQYRLTDVQLAHLPDVRVGTRREATPAEPPLSGGTGPGPFGDEVRRWLAGPPDERGVM